MKETLMESKELNLPGLVQEGAERCARDGMGLALAKAGGSRGGGTWLAWEGRGRVGEGRGGGGTKSNGVRR